MKNYKKNTVNKNSRRILRNAGGRKKGTLTNTKEFGRHQTVKFNNK
jgi:hypothetical protein